MLVSWKMCDESRVVLEYESLAGDFELLAFRPGSEKSSIAETALRYSLWWMKKEKKMFCGGIEERVVEEGKRKKFPGTLCARDKVQNEPQQKTQQHQHQKRTKSTGTET